MNNWESGYQKLIVWKETRKLVALVYQLAKKFPRNEDFGLTSQLRRAVVSILINIAEGWMRQSIKDKLRFLEIAQGSLLEIESIAIVALDVGYWGQSEFEQFSQQRGRVAYLLYRYKQSIEFRAH